MTRTEAAVPDDYPDGTARSLLASGAGGIAALELANVAGVRSAGCF